MDLPCEFCSRRFTSRNAVFRHLRDPTNSCGAYVEAEGGIGDAPSEVAVATSIAAPLEQAGTSKDKRPVRPRPKRVQRSFVGRGIDSTPDAELWLGDLPSSLTTRALASLLHQRLARAIGGDGAGGDEEETRQPLPFAVKRHILRAYRPLPPPAPTTDTRCGGQGGGEQASAGDPALIVPADDASTAATSVPRAPWTRGLHC